MQTGFRGTFVISWTQTELDGQRVAPVSLVFAGQAWRWTGEALRVDGPQSVAALAATEAMVTLRRRVRHVARRVSGGGRSRPAEHVGVAESGIADQSFTVTDGRHIWPVALIAAGRGGAQLALFPDGVPPRDTDLWVVQAQVVPQAAAGKGLLCFTPGTMILTEHGPITVEELGTGDRVQTKDSGCQPVDWIGQSRVTGARMRAMPHLAPVRLGPGALGQDVPDGGLLVSPDHRIVLGGARARVLFNVDEVLVAARDLVNDRNIRVERGLPEVSYFHLLLPRHEIVFANGVETESFHPEGFDWSDDDGAALACPVPPASYGGYARRILTRGEAAILCRDMA